MLAFVAFALLSVGISKASGRGWTLLSGTLSLAIILATVSYAFPILRRMIVENGAGLTDAQIVEQVQAWILWSRLRLVGLIIAWTAIIVGLVQHAARAHQPFNSDLRWK